MVNIIEACHFEWASDSAIVIFLFIDWSSNLVCCWALAHKDVFIIITNNIQWISKDDVYLGPKNH